MKRFLMLTTFLVVAVVFCISAKGDRIKGNGTVTTAVREFPTVRGIRLEGSTQVVITKGAVQQVGVKGYTNILPYMETHMEGPILVIGTSKDAHIQNDNTVVYLELADLEFIKVQGSGNVTVNGAFETQNLVVSVLGSANVKLQKGAADNLGIEVSGSGNVEAYNFKTRKATVNVSGSGNVQLNASESLKAVISGSGNVYYKGAPPEVKPYVSGSGQVTAQ